MVFVIFGVETFPEEGLLDLEAKKEAISRNEFYLELKGPHSFGTTEHSSNMNPG